MMLSRPASTSLELDSWRGGTPAWPGEEANAIGCAKVSGYMG